VCDVVTVEQMFGMEPLLLLELVGMVVSVVDL
jgi:hypothetical protein